MKNYITTLLEVTVENGDRFTTGFNIMPAMLIDKSIQKLVDDYYVGSSYGYNNETTLKIVKVEVLSIEI
jgi:hypothetical protein